MSDLLRTAILGTGQVAGAEPGTGTVADELVSKLGQLERERALLLRAGGAAILERAGQRPRALKGTLDQAPPETLSCAPPGLAHLFERLLRGEHHHVLPEVLERSAARGYRLPEELLPLALREDDAKLRTLLLPLLGERGRWLSSRRAEWSWAAGAASVSAELPADADQRWAEGTTAERKGLLAAARRLAPERGRAWVESTFKADKPELRVVWLQALEAGLSQGDVPFLEAALGDRSQMVRVAAARVLWRLPGSVTARAIGERLEALVPTPAPPSTSMWSKLKGAVARGGPALDVRMPPEEFDKALEKLGVLESPPWQQIGRRQWWLAQHVAAVDPGWFVERLASSPEALVQAAVKHDLGHALINGWSSAALRFEARAWFAPLWDVWLDSFELQSWFNEQPLERLSQRLTPAELEPRLLPCLREQSHLELLAHLPRPWPESIARAFLDLLRSGAGLNHVLPLAASRLPVELVPAGLTLPEQGSESPAYRNAFDDFMSAIELRRRLAQELSR